MRSAAYRCTQLQLKSNIKHGSRAPSKSTVTVPAPFPLFQEELCKTLQLESLGASLRFSYVLPNIKMPELTTLFFPSRVGRGKGNHGGAVIQYIKYKCMYVYIYKESREKRAKKLQNPWANYNWLFSPSIFFHL